ncbi:amidohydrolase family protein [Kribbella catacumbae]|uniref:amidohydrolase family protein n=1 Tax=Kribbella catacumbae TaxID=460086 RepID=UPI000374DF33|nr:amidohydrolase family protein [Kribbella catacumbae]
MATWVFDGIGLPAGEQVHLEAGSGDPQPLPGRFALPGLVDSHCHLTIGVGVGERSLVLQGEDAASAMLDDLAQAGVGALRDVGGDRSITLKLASSPEDGRPVVLAAGRFVAPKGGYFPGLHEPVPAEELVAAIEAELDAGATWIKLVGDFPEVGPDGPIPGSTMTPNYELDAVAEMVAAVHARGARVAVHTTTDVVSDLIRVGIDSVEHGTTITAEDLETLGARGGAWTPTLSAIMHGSPDDSPELIERRRIRSEYMASMLPLARQYGVRVLAGSDVFGTVASEVDQLVKHGLSVTEALEAASTSAQDFLGLTGQGDLVTYDADPRDHPEVLATPAAVVLRGRRIR